MWTIYGAFVKFNNQILTGCYQSRVYTSLAPWCSSPGPRPELPRDRQVNQAGNERTLILEGWHDLDPHTAFQPRTFELNVTLASITCTSLLECIRAVSDVFWPWSSCLDVLFLARWVQIYLGMAWYIWTQAEVFEPVCILSLPVQGPGSPSHT